MINHRRTTIASLAIVMLLLILTPSPVMAIENCSVEAWDTSIGTPTNQCHYCSSSYSWNPIEKKCQDTTGSNCLIFSPSSISPITTCLRCDCKQALDSTNKCVDSNIANCEQISVVGATTTCSLCRNGDLYGYGKEDFGLKADKSACIDNTGKTPNCQTYSSTDACTECHSGYIFFTAPTEPQFRCLIRDSLQFCATGSITGTEPNLNYICSTCLSGFKKNAANTACSASMAPGCLTSDFSDNCTGTCDTSNGWTLDTVNKSCTKGCNSPLVKSSDGLNCVPGAHTSCFNKGSAADCTCASPTAVYTFNRKQCASTPNNCIRQGPSGVSGCAECAANHQLVISMNDPTQWNCMLITSTTKRVENCWVAYPVQSPDASDILHCRICKPEFILGEDYQCYKQMTGCPWWAQQSDLLCTWCSKGYYLQNDKCVILPAQIDNWCDAFDDSFKCTKCKDGFQWNDTNSICQRISAASIIANCDHYMKDDATQCMHCADGYFTSTNSQICYPRIENCEDYNATGGCIKCRVGLGYVLQSGMCVMTPSFGCTQVDSNDACISCIHEKQNGIELDFYLDVTNKICVNNKGKIAHCKEYTSASVCKTCHDSIAVSVSGGNCPIPNTDNCLIFDPESFNCLVQGITNCESYGSTPDNQCSQCQSGFKLNGYVESTSSGDSCVADTTISYCTAYNASNQCLQCQSNYAITGWDATSKSGSACISNIVVNDSIQTAYKIGKRNGCIKFNTAGVCTECDSMFALDSSVNPPACKSNTITNCVKSHPTDSTKCTSCAATFTLDGYDTSTSVGTSCKAMGNTNCLAFSEAACLLCMPKFTKKADSTGCQKPTGVVEGEEKQFGKHRSCDTAVNYVLKQDLNFSYGTCILKGATDADIDGVYKPITGCIQYDSTKDTFRTCLKCDVKLLPDSTGANCVGITDCEMYSTSDPYKCSKCLPGKALSDWTPQTDFGTKCVTVPVGPLTDCEAINSTVTLCLKCGNNKTLDANGACVGGPNTIAGCTTYVGNKILKCLTCDALTNKVLLGTTLSTLQDGGTKCVDNTLSDPDLDPIKTTTYGGTLPADCIAYDTTSTLQVCVKCGNSKFLMPGSGTPANSICGVIANCQTMVDAVTKIGACYECLSGFYLVQDYNSAKHNQGGTVCENEASTSTEMTTVKTLYTTFPTNCKAFDSNGQCAACQAGFQLNTDLVKPDCVTIANCSTPVENKNLNKNGRCLACSTNFSLFTDYDNTKPEEGASSCLADTTGCIAQNPSTSNCVKCASPKFLNSSGACVDPPTGCTVPHASDNTKCAQCNGTTHLLQGDKCVGDVTTNKQLLRPAQCGVYDKSGKCVWCFGTFINDSTNNGCKDLSADLNLKDCSFTKLEGTTDKCVTCSSGNVLAGVIAPSTLGTQCVPQVLPSASPPYNIQNCVAYDNSDKCVKCAIKFGITSNGNVNSCAKPTNCDSADPSDGTQCLTCDADYILKLDISNNNTTQGSCVDRRLNDNSTSYDTKYPYMISQCHAYLTTGFCGICQNGLSLDAKQMCAGTPVTNNTSDDPKCITQVLNEPTKCNICMKPYRPDDNGMCRITSVDNCKQYGTSPTTCKECVEGYYLNLSNSCVSCAGNLKFDTTATVLDCQITKIPNCKTSSDGFASCSQCDANYLPSYNLGQCVSIATSIAKCLKVNSLDSSPGTKCLECQAGSDIKPETSACVTQITGCKVYSAAGDCSECYHPNYYLSVQTSTSGTQTQSCTIANVPFCIENQAQTDACPFCCNKCFDGFGLKSWTEGTVTKHACVYNKLQCAQERCISYESFTDWSLSTCTNLAPLPPSPSSNSSGSNSNVTPKPNTNDSLNTILINTVALVAIVVSVSVLL